MTYLIGVLLFAAALWLAKVLRASRATKCVQCARCRRRVPSTFGEEVPYKLESDGEDFLCNVCLGHAKSYPGGDPGPS